jgi:hypothetical protein
MKVWSGERVRAVTDPAVEASSEGTQREQVRTLSVFRWQPEHGNERADVQILSFPYQPLISPLKSQTPTQPLSVPTHIIPSADMTVGTPSSPLFSFRPSAPAIAPRLASFADDRLGYKK